MNLIENRQWYRLALKAENLNVYLRTGCHNYFQNLCPLFICFSSEIVLFLIMLSLKSERIATKVKILL